MITKLSKILMTSAQAKFNRFLLYRMLIALFMLFKLLMLKPHWLDFYGANGFFPRDILELTNYTILNYFRVLDGLSSLLNVSTDYASLILLRVGILASVGLFLGLFTRFSVLFLLLLNVSLTNTFMEYSYGADFFISSLLFYALFFPLGLEYSVDKFVFRNNKVSEILCSVFVIEEKHAVIIMGIHLSIIYFIGGITKFFGPSWWDGSAIWTAIHRPGLELAFLLSRVISVKIVFIMLGIATIIVELAYPLMIWLKPTRRLWLFLTLGMHFFIGVVLELYLFASVMMLFNTVAFGGNSNPVGYLKRGFSRKYPGKDTRHKSRSYSSLTS